MNNQQQCFYNNQQTREVIERLKFLEWQKWRTEQDKCCRLIANERYKLANDFLLTHLKQHYDPMNLINVLYRNKLTNYFVNIAMFYRGCMMPYIKDNSGHTNNGINLDLNALFFHANVMNSTADGLPDRSPFGDCRFTVHADHLLNPLTHSYYFCDFYCNRGKKLLTERPHYVLIVIFRVGSDVEKRFSGRLKQIDPYCNPFLLCKKIRGNRVYYVANAKNLWVEIAYTGNIDLQWGQVNRMQHPELCGAGSRPVYGVPVNENCEHCNLALHHQRMVENCCSMENYRPNPNESSIQNNIQTPPSNQSNVQTPIPSNQNNLQPPIPSNQSNLQIPKPSNQNNFPTPKLLSQNPAITPIPLHQNPAPSPNPSNQPALKPLTPFERRMAANADYFASFTAGGSRGQANGTKTSDSNRNNSNRRDEREDQSNGTYRNRIPNGDQSIRTYYNRDRYSNQSDRSYSNHTRQEDRQSYISNDRTRYDSQSPSRYQQDYDDRERFCDERGPDYNDGNRYDNNGYREFGSQRYEESDRNRSGRDDRSQDNSYEDRDWNRSEDSRYHQDRNGHYHDGSREYNGRSGDYNRGIGNQGRSQNYEDRNDYRLDAYRSDRSEEDYVGYEEDRGYQGRREDAGYRSSRNRDNSDGYYDDGVDSRRLSAGMENLRVSGSRTSSNYS